jgi:hypothetical protein
LLSFSTDTISELKLGNGTSVLIFANIASSLPTSVGALLAQNTESNPTNVAIYATAFFLTTLGIIYVQEAERRIPVNYSSRCAASGLSTLGNVCQPQTPHPGSWLPVAGFILLPCLAASSQAWQHSCCSRACSMHAQQQQLGCWQQWLCWRQWLPACVCCRYQAGSGLARQSYLPFKVNATGEDAPLHQHMPQDSKAADGSASIAGLDQQQQAKLHCGSANIKMHAAVAHLAVVAP